MSDNPEMPISQPEVPQPPAPKPAVTVIGTRNPFDAYVRRSESGEKVLDFQLLGSDFNNFIERVNFINEIKYLAHDTKFDFGADANNAEKKAKIEQVAESTVHTVLYGIDGEPTIEKDTENIVRDHFVAFAAAEHGVRL